MTASAPSDARREERQRFISFVATGGCAAIVNVGCRILLSKVMIFEAAVALAYLVGMTTAFLLARRFVFGAAGPWHREYMKFATVNVFAFIQVLLVSDLFDRLLFPWAGWTWRREELSHMIGVASPIVVSYYAHKHFSFRKAAGTSVEERP